MVVVNMLKGVLVYCLIWIGCLLFIVYINVDLVLLGVFDVLVYVVGLIVDVVFDLVFGVVDFDKWVIYVLCENLEVVWVVVFEVGVGYIGDYLYCSWSVVGIG